MAPEKTEIEKAETQAEGAPANTEEVVHSIKGFDVTGENEAATASGDQGAATASGYQGAATASGEFSVAISSGLEGKARGEIGTAICLVCRDEDSGEIIAIRATKIGENGTKPGVWYRLNADGEFNEVED
jgi:hypothetical protein